MCLRQVVERTCMVAVEGEGEKEFTFEEKKKEAACNLRTNDVSCKMWDGRED